MSLALTFYQDENANHPTLRRDEERALLRRARAGDRQAQDLLLRHNQRLVFSMARRILPLAGDQEILDLVQWGNMGLLRAIEKWDEHNTNTFTTYAFWWIKLYIRRFGLNHGNTIRLSHCGDDARQTIRRAIARLYQQLRREPTPAEIAAETGLSPARVNEILPMLAPVGSLDAPCGDDDNAALVDLLPGASSPEHQVERKLLLANVIASLPNLTPNQAQVIRLLYGIGCPPLTQNEVARRMGVSHTRVQQIERQAIASLQRILKE